MVLSNTPPAGAGQVHRTTKTDALLKIIEGLPRDKFNNPTGIRTKPLSEISGVPANSIQVLLTPHIKSGRLVTCKVTVPGEHPQLEYRVGPGVQPPEFKPLNTKRAGIALTAPARPTRTAPALSTLKPTVEEIVTPQLIQQPQPAVGTTTPAAGNPALPGVEPAVAAQATPKPKARARMKTAPAPRKASAGDVLDISIDRTGTLIIATEDGVFELDPKQARTLGHFMGATHGVWNPF